MTARVNDAEWLRRQLGVDDSSGEGGGRDVGENHRATTDTGDNQELIVGGLGEPVHASIDTAQLDQDVAGLRSGRLHRKVLIRFGSLATVGIVVSVLCATLLGGGGEPARPGNESGAVVTSATPTPVADETAGVDRPLPFTAAANCPAGSTSAQTLAGADPTNAFVCVRGLIDGQVIRLELPKTYVITAIAITPGWVGMDSSGRSQWAQHRVVTRVQYAFNDTDRTIVVQDTGNVHGEAVQPVKHVLASKVTMLILQTSRPPAETTISSTPGFGPPIGGLFSGPGTDLNLPSLPAPSLGLGGQTTTDPVDSTFAINSLKIIGHEAI